MAEDETSGLNVRAGSSNSAVDSAHPMKLVVVTAESNQPWEHAVLAELFADGLERCHVRKPHASTDELARWIERVPREFRSRLVTHQHHELVQRYGLGGCHWKDAAFAPIVATPGATFCSRSCHNLETLRASLGIYHAVFFGPVFDSISKRGYGPGSVAAGERSRNEVSAFLRDRTVAQRRTTIVALGGIDAMTAPQALALGFDGVAVLGAVWLADDPVKAWREIAASCGVSHLKTPLNPNSGVGEPDALQPLRKAV